VIARGWPQALKNTKAAGHSCAATARVGNGTYLFGKADDATIGERRGVMQARGE